MKCIQLFYAIPVMAVALESATHVSAKNLKSEKWVVINMNARRQYVGFLKINAAKYMYVWRHAVCHNFGCLYFVSSTLSCKTDVFMDIHFDPHYSKAVFLGLKKLVLCVFMSRSIAASFHGSLRYAVHCCLEETSTKYLSIIVRGQELAFNHWPRTKTGVKVEICVWECRGSGVCHSVIIVM